MAQITTRPLRLGPSSLHRAAPSLPRGGKIVRRAQQPGGDRDGSSTDWDAAWRSFQKQVRSQVDTSPVTTNVRPLQPLPRNSQEQLRRQERVLLDLWTSEDALKWGSLALVAGLLVVVASAGAPIDDGRCTLPWC